MLRGGPISTACVGEIQLNGGKVWRKVSDYSIRSLAFDAGLDSRIFFAATSGGTKPGALMISNDGGSSLWESNTGFTNRNFTTLTGAGLSLYSSSVYEAGIGGAYRTETLAARWVQAGGPAGDELVQMATAPDDQKRLYAAGYHTLSESRDGGQHWTTRKPPVEGSPVGALMPLPGGVLLAGTASGLFRSVDGGAWSSGAGDGVQSFQRSAGDVVAAMTATGALVSTDAGLTWKACGDAGPKGSWYGLSFGANIALAASAGRPFSLDRWLPDVGPGAQRAGYPDRQSRLIPPHARGRSLCLARWQDICFNRRRPALAANRR